MEKKALVIYHGPSCLDGMAAAWCMWKLLGDAAEYIVGSYQSAEEIDFKDRVVYLVDFSYNRAYMETKILSVAKMVYLIDHHKSALEDLIGLSGEWPNLDITYCSLERSGAMLAKHFVEARGPWELDAPLIKIIQDRDLWMFEYPTTKAITEALFSYDLDYQSIDRYMGMNPHVVEDMINTGNILLSKKETDIAALIRMGMRMVPAATFGHITEDGLLVPICNAPPMYSSDIGNVLSQEHPFAITYHDMLTTRNYSLRSSKENPDAVDVSRIATVFGGGGHKHAAGFKIKLAIAASIV